MSSLASAGRMNPALSSALVSAAHFRAKRRCVGYRAASLAELNGTVVPNRKQNADPDWPRPDKVATGTSTAGVRMPPSTLPLASVTKDGGDVDVFTCRSGGAGGACPVLTHRFSQNWAASSTKCSSPVLIGVVQVTPAAPAGGLSIASSS